MAEGRFIAYLRVSTDKQGRSGLGLEAQRRAVRDFLNGGQWYLLAEHVEVESGRRSDRPQLAAALAACRARRATLAVAKLDRLSRNVPFLRSLTDAGVDVVFADMPNVPDGAMGRFILTQMAAVAELEAGLTSERTRAALAAAKARGVKLGGAKPGAEGRARAVAPLGWAARVRQAEARARDLAPVVAEIRAGGTTTLEGIARALNEAGYSAPRGGSWGAAQVLRLLRRLDAVAPLAREASAAP
jgi:DNA invertase Pin-like site-specific DNA recombinase